jgi:hypothetical protein
VELLDVAADLEQGLAGLVEVVHALRIRVEAERREHAREQVLRRVEHLHAAGLELGGILRLKTVSQVLSGTSPSRSLTFLTFTPIPVVPHM